MKSGVEVLPAMYCQWNGVGLLSAEIPIDSYCVDIQRENEYIPFQKVALLSDSPHSCLLLTGKSPA